MWQNKSISCKWKLQYQHLFLKKIPGVACLQSPQFHQRNSTLNQSPLLPKILYLSLCLTLFYSFLFTMLTLLTPNTTAIHRIKYTNTVVIEYPDLKVTSFQIHQKPPWSRLLDNMPFQNFYSIISYGVQSICYRLAKTAFLTCCIIHVP